MIFGLEMECQDGRGVYLEFDAHAAVVSECGGRDRASEVRREWDAELSLLDRH